MPQRNHVIVGALLASLVALAACGGTSTGGGNGTPAANTTATSAPKAKPTGMPTITVPFCQGLMTIDEANQIMKPATQANTIRVDAPSTGGGSCNWEYAQYKAIVIVLFEPFPQGASLDAVTSAALAAEQNAPGAKSSKTTVTGVGDQAIFLTVSAQVGAGIWENLLDTTDGPILISCNVVGVGAPPSTSLQAPLTQVCKQVVNHL